MAPLGIKVAPFKSACKKVLFIFLSRISIFFMFFCQEKAFLSFFPDWPLWTLAIVLILFENSFITRVEISYDEGFRAEVGPDCPFCQDPGPALAAKDQGGSSTCGPEATARGPGQKVISYSLFGTRNVKKENEQKKDIQIRMISFLKFY